MKIKIIFSFLSAIFFGGGLVFVSMDGRSGGVLGVMETASTPVSVGYQATSSVAGTNVQSEPAEADDGRSEPLSVPSLQATLSGADSVSLQWTRPENAFGPVSYGVVRNGRVIATLSEKFSYRDEGLQQGAGYSYSLKAKDSFDRKASTRSVEVAVPGRQTEAEERLPVETSSTGGGVSLSTSDVMPVQTGRAEISSVGTVSSRSVSESGTSGNTGIASTSDVLRSTASAPVSVPPKNTRASGTVSAPSVSPTVVSVGSSSADEKQRALERKLELQRAQEREALEQEARVSSVPVETLLTRDVDGDGLSDAEEIRIGTDPRVSDTDGDGYKDGEEVKKGYSPVKSAESDRGDKIVFESPKEKRISKEAMEDKKLRIEKVERVKKADGSAVTKLSGKGTPNSYLTVYIYSNPIVVTVKTDADGNWTYELDRDLEDGVHEAYVAVTDATGKISTQSSPISFVKTAEAVSVVSASELEKEADGNRSPAERIGAEFVFFGFVLAVAFSLIAFYFVGRRALLDR